MYTPEELRTQSRAREHDSQSILVALSNWRNKTGLRRQLALESLSRRLAERFDIYG